MLLPVGCDCVLPDNSGKLLADLIAGHAANSGSFISDRRKRSGLSIFTAHFLVQL